MKTACSFFRPPDLPAALSFLAEHGREARVVAGGTDLLVEKRSRGEWPEGCRYLVDITALGELDHIIEEEGALRLGAVVSHAMLAADPLVRAHAPFLAEAAAAVGSPQIRNRGTLGGNVANASPAADTLPPLACLNARCRLESEAGERVVPLEEFIIGPYETCLEPGELLSEIMVDKAGLPAGSAFIKVGRRKALAIARLSVAVLLRRDGSGRLRDVRIAPGAAFPTPARARQAEAVLEGGHPDPELLEKASAAVAGEMIGRSGVRWSTDYKHPVLAGITARAIRKALEVSG